MRSMVCVNLIAIFWGAAVQPARLTLKMTKERVVTSRHKEVAKGVLKLHLYQTLPKDVNGTKNQEVVKLNATF